VQIANPKKAKLFADLKTDWRIKVEVTLGVCHIGDGKRIAEA
jgi:hypothetical protein